MTGIVLGSWNSSGRMDDLRLLMDEFFADRGVPVLWEQGFGHDPHALSVPLNVDRTARRIRLRPSADRDRRHRMNLPELDSRAKWTVHVVDAASGEELLSHGADVVCETASIGKVFLLLEVARSARVR